MIYSSLVSKLSLSGGPQPHSFETPALKNMSVERLGCPHPPDDLLSLSCITAGVKQEHTQYTVT